MKFVPLFILVLAVPAFGQVSLGPLPHGDVGKINTEVEVFFDLIEKRQAEYIRKKTLPDGSQTQPARYIQMLPPAAMNDGTKAVAVDLTRTRPSDRQVSIVGDAGGVDVVPTVKTLQANYWVDEYLATCGIGYVATVQIKAGGKEYIRKRHVGCEALDLPADGDRAWREAAATVVIGPQ